MPIFKREPQAKTCVIARLACKPWQSVPPREFSMTYYVYILASPTNVTIYTGVTNDLVRRVYEHKHHADPKSFTAKYSVNRLVYFEQTTDVRAALEREKQIKSWKRARKNALVESMNPKWEDLYPKILG